jgi:hypothetical protein
MAAIMTVTIRCPCCHLGGKDAAHYHYGVEAPDPGTPLAAGTGAWGRAIGMVA